MEAESLARRIERSTAEARDLLRCHHEQYRIFWKWSDAAMDYAMLKGSLTTVFGWRIQVRPGTNPRTLRNYPMQANGAEMLRLACCLATERGVQVSAPIHDAILIEAPLERLDAAIIVAQECMGEATRNRNVGHGATDPGGTSNMCAWCQGFFKSLTPGAHHFDTGRTPVQSYMFILSLSL
jgi:DNA polymerase I-like protein with 3'-5' exonuclease and polymerase domains